MKSIFKIMIVLVAGICLTACSTQSQSDTESLYETEGVDLSKGWRPGCKNGC